MSHALIHFDGACTGNPGPTGYGAVVDIEGNRHTISEPGGRGTNNTAEYGGLIAGLKAALNAGATSVEVRGDSQLVIRQLEGRYQVKAPNLKPYFEEAKALLGQFERIKLVWVRREQNAAADQAARDGIR